MFHRGMVIAVRSAVFVPLFVELEVRGSNAFLPTPSLHDISINIMFNSAVSRVCHFEHCFANLLVHGFK